MANYQVTDGILSGEFPFTGNFVDIISRRKWNDV